MRTLEVLYLKRQFIVRSELLMIEMIEVLLHLLVKVLHLFESG